MILLPDMAWFHVPKTAGRFIGRELLKAGGEYWPNPQPKLPRIPITWERRTWQKHTRAGPAGLTFHRRRCDIPGPLPETLYAGVRNPWDWYVSQWAFHDQQRWASWKAFRAGFKPWLQSILVEFGGGRKWHHTAINDEHLFDRLRDTGIGLFTFRVLFYTHPARDAVQLPDDIHWLRFEHLEEDVGAMFARHLPDYRFVNQRYLPSKRDRDFRVYYDAESVEWVAHAERQIIERFGYTWCRKGRT